MNIKFPLYIWNSYGGWVGDLEQHRRWKADLVDHRSSWMVFAIDYPFQGFIPSFWYIYKYKCIWFFIVGGGRRGRSVMNGWWLICMALLNFWTYCDVLNLAHVPATSALMMATQHGVASLSSSSSMVTLPAPRLCWILSSSCFNPSQQY